MKHTCKCGGECVNVTTYLNFGSEFVYVLALLMNLKKHSQKVHKIYGNFKFYSA